MNIQELIAALEVADGPSRELDCAIESWAVKMPVCIGEFGPMPFTSSIDAAIKLVPEGYTWSISNRALIGGTGCFASVLGPDDEYLFCEYHGATPAIALCINTLKARAEMECRG